MALRDWLDTGKCLLGFHEGEWIREHPNSCVLIQTCNRCRATSQRVEHQWAEWRYVSEHNCALERSCSRCAEKENHTEHQWGNWSYKDHGGCEQGIQCERCGNWSADSRMEHEWGEWNYVERYRAPLHACLRCSTAASYFHDQTVDAEANESSYSELEKARQLASSDDTIADMLERAQVHPKSAPVPMGDSEISEEDDPDWQENGLKMLRQMYEEQIQSGVIAPERRPLFNSIMAELEEVTRNSGSTLAEKQIKLRRLQDAMIRLREAILDPSRGTELQESAAGTRLALIAELHNELYRYVHTEVSVGNLTGEEGQAAVALFSELRDTREALANMPADGEPLKLEHETLRQLSLNIRNFSLRDHLTLISPIWPTHTSAQNASSVFYSGGSELGESLERACTARKLRRLIPQPTREPASLRWNQLREAALASFDFTGFKKNLPLEEMSDVATVAYELGIALALGRPSVIVAFENQELPFDLDLRPVRVKPQSDATAKLGLALDQNLYGLQRGRAGTSVRASMEFLRSRYQFSGDFRVRGSLASIDAEAERDPVKARLLIASTLGFVGAGALQIAFPSWPGDYPDSSAKRCFHVTAFGPPWADTTSRLVEEACGTEIHYIRGDKVLQRDILRSIWDEICRATHVVVDLTGLNANVAFELGIADTLGRNVMLISQDRQPEKYFPAIAKQRIHPYTVESDAAIANFSSTLKEFLL